MDNQMILKKVLSHMIGRGFIEIKVVMIELDLDPIKANAVESILVSKNYIIGTKSGCAITSLGEAFVYDFTDEPPKQHPTNIVFHNSNLTNVTGIGNISGRNSTTFSTIKSPEKETNLKKILGIVAGVIAVIFAILKGFGVV